MPFITLLNNKKYYFRSSVSFIEIINFLNKSGKKNYVAGKINGKLTSFFSRILDNSEISFIVKKDIYSLQLIRFSCVYILGLVIKRLWPSVEIANSQLFSDGFYCDIDMKKSLKEKDLFLLENKMKEFIKKNYLLYSKKISLKKAKLFLLKINAYYKYSLIKDYDINSDLWIFLNKQYTDVFPLPCVFKTKFCRYFKLHKLSGVYWKGNSKNKMLQRIYGTAWFSKLDLNNYLKYLNNKYVFDHRKIAKILNLYHFNKKIPGLIFWHENGFFLIKKLKKFLRYKFRKYSYKEVSTPIILNRSIWKNTGHWKNYKKNIFTTFFEKKQYCIKPMNCPGHVEIFKYNLKSYKDLPIRISEFGICHRNETSGSLHGLMRVKSFIQDDGHIFCTRSQIFQEISNCIKMIYDIYKVFKFVSIFVRLSTRPKKKVGNNKIWDMTENILLVVLKRNNINFEYQYGKGAFYGPKIEFVLMDSLKRLWQCGTIQLDFSLPCLLNAWYIDKNNVKKNPVMIHRAALGSIERFIGILTEQCNGYYPIWLSPIQLVIINVTKSQINYVLDIKKKLLSNGFRIESDLREKTVNFKIRECVLKKIPYIIVCGDKEMLYKTISIRYYNKKNIDNFSIKYFIKKFKKKFLQWN